MTHEGVKRLLRVMISAYPNYHPADINATISVWENILKDYSDKDAALALDTYIRNDTKGFAPAIGQIIDLIHTDDSGLGELEAWGLVRKAIRNGIYGAESEYNKLPEVVRVALGSPGQIRSWAAMDIDSVESVAQSNFLRSFRAAKEREKMYLKSSPEQQRLTQRKGGEMELEEKEPKEEYNGIPMPEELKKMLRKMRR